MKSFRVLVLLLSFVTDVSGTVNDTPQQVVTKYNNYKTICTGLGYKATQCNGEQTKVIGFQSSLKGDLVKLKTRETVIFNQASLNRGSAYDTTTGKFTAPADGVYSFSWTTMSDAEKYFITEIVLNSSPIACNFTDGRGRTKNAGNVMSSSNVIIEMRTGDKVWIRTHHNYGQFARCGDGQWCIFSGFKL
ncbi:complement C1q tumor necrosis factor-related protein 4-like [Crassostrea angulata]|uniref:complement C1q tumor necrosis factor-related protein 4-like n=1 Tax=Magallana angulata TaxID=2784310 RepID=UPI0022B1C6CE|nr:complement C1q tumor necrosis factor-related protein 4-like [Crassostrea angulata]